MDQIIIESKIDSILRCVHRITSRLPETRKLFLQDLDAQDVIVLNLSRCVQLSVDLAMHICATSMDKLPQTMGQSFDALLTMNVIKESIAIKMKKSVGFRNVAVHNYDEIDMDLTYNIASKHLEDFIEFIRQIQGYFEFHRG